LGTKTESKAMDANDFKTGLVRRAGKTKEIQIKLVYQSLIHWAGKMEKEKEKEGETNTRKERKYKVKD